MNPISVSVRALCEFTAKQGDLDLRFTPSPTSAQGMEGHKWVRNQRQAGYEAEISLEGLYKDLLVKGRADGFAPTSKRLEEVKTYRGKLEGIRAHHRALHWAQAKIYAHLLCQSRDFPELNVALVYFNIDTQKESVLSEFCSAADLKIHFETLCQRYVEWAQHQAQHHSARDTALQRLTFPMGKFRAGQREMSVAVYRTAMLPDKGQLLLAQAPTGIGKSIGTLFPILKACADNHLDKVFYLTAKNTGHALAEQALGSINQQIGGSTAGCLRGITLYAKEKSCEHPDKACHGDSCPLAKSFYDHLPTAREEISSTTDWGKEQIRSIALKHEVCPYYLTQELVKWADVVIGDYNYFYDRSAMLAAMTRSYQWKVGVLVDESHNLVDRARAMYSGELAQFDLASAIKHASGTIKRNLNALNRAWNELNQESRQAYHVLSDIPATWLKALNKAIVRIGEVNAENPMLPDNPVLSFYLNALNFEDLANQLGNYAFVDLTRSNSAKSDRSYSRLNIRNVIPAPFLEVRHETAHATVMFSGTLTPNHFYSDMLGFPEDWYWVDVPTPFKQEQLQVHVSHDISTKYKDRNASLTQLMQTISGQYNSRPGNYLCFLSSFEYLDMVLGAFQDKYPEIPIAQQYRGMDDQAKDDFLASFSNISQQVGFVVLGGVFGEGVDLPGERLIGVFIATLGLPQFNPINENNQRVMESVFGKEHAYNYTYLYPGLRKVIQAGGRLIRTEQDYGVIYLMDDRYNQRELRGLLPPLWN